MPTDVSGRVPVVLVLPGSGPTDCDGNSAGMKNDSLKLLGKAIASKGIAACRIDKRGIGRSAAAMVKESELSFETYVFDAVAWVKLLKSDPRFSQVHVIGHSEGSLVGILAAQEIEVASFISVAGAGQRASDLMRAQLKSKIPETGMKQVETILAKLEAGDLVTELSPGLHLLFRPSVQPYLISWFRYDPVKEIAKLKDLPVLIVQGNTDIQCRPSDADTLASAMPSANKTIIAGMNHVLKKIEGETVSSQLVAYTDPSLPLHEQLVPTIVDFIRKR
jgi:pimeloyl-ACP methyl ester carboxylesterase